MQEVTPEEAQKCLPDLIEAALKGESVFITTVSGQGVQLVPVPRTAPQRHFGSAKGLIKIADDLDAPLPDFDC